MEAHGTELAPLARPRSALTRLQPGEKTTSVMKVLVIEDEPQIRDIFAEFVELLGHEADVAVDGAMAWRASTRSSTRSWSRTSSCRD